MKYKIGLRKTDEGYSVSMEEEVFGELLESAHQALDPRASQLARPPLAVTGFHWPAQAAPRRQ